MIRSLRAVIVQGSHDSPDGALRKGKGATAGMLEPKDFATGCATIILCALLLPLFYVVFKLTLFLAVVLAIAVGVILGITVVGRIVRYFITGK